MERTAEGPGAANEHEVAERDVRTFKYDGAGGTDYGGGVKKIVVLGSTPRERLAVQIVKEGGENNLHFHKNTDILYMVLKGRVKFHGPEDMVYGEFGPHEGLVIPANSRYWFETTGDVPLELFQVFFFTDDPATAKRVNVDAAKDWMAGVAALQIYEQGRSDAPAA